MPKILDSEGNELKNLINSWFNKDIRKAKRLKLAYSNFDIKSEIHLYNFDLKLLGVSRTIFFKKSS
jgi:hypothetical protein